MANMSHFTLEKEPPKRGSHSGLNYFAFAKQPEHLVGGHQHNVNIL